MKRVRFNRASIEEAINAAKRLQSNNALYIFATRLGYTIAGEKPPFGQSYLIVRPNGETERFIEKFTNDSP